MTELTGQLVEAATEHTGLDEGATDQTDELTGQLGEPATGLTGGTELGEKQGEDEESAKSRHGRDKYGQRGKQPGSQTGLGTAIDEKQTGLSTSTDDRPHVVAAVEHDGRVDKLDVTLDTTGLEAGRDNKETA